MFGPQGRINTGQAIARHGGIFPPAEFNGFKQIARLPIGMMALDHLRHRGAVHCLPNGNTASVIRLSRNAPAHIGVHRQPARLAQNLSLCCSGDVVCLHSERIQRGHAVRVVIQNPGLVVSGHEGLSFRITGGEF